MITALYYESISKRFDLADIRTKEYDIKTCTAADYTIRVDIPDKWYKGYLNQRD